MAGLNRISSSIGSGHLVGRRVRDIVDEGLVDLLRHEILLLDLDLEVDLCGHSDVAGVVSGGSRCRE